MGLKPGNTKMTTATLEVTHYETQVHLGWPDQEREKPQKIALDITLRYKKMPEGCISDDAIIMKQV